MSRKKKSLSKPLGTAPSALAQKGPPLRESSSPRISVPRQSSARSPQDTPFRVIFLVSLAIVFVTILAYCNSFTGSFIFDDDQAIIRNNTIQHLWSWAPLFPPYWLTVGGRPLLNLSFAINYAISGMSPWSYHVLNLLVHLLAGVTLLGVLRRTFLQPVMRERFGSDSLLLAAAITLLWILNPLHTECVSYISQRAESLMGLCYLLTIYCFIRATEPQSITPRRWAFLAIVCCTAGAAFKEIIISAPIMVLLYDRTFVAGTFLRALCRRWGFYLALAFCCWLVIAYGMKDIKGHGNVQGRIVGYQFGVTGWDYALTECPALLHYLVLMVWPQPLIIDYGMQIFTNLDDVLPQAIGVVILLVATLVALIRWPLIGFAGVWFFLILAPTSSFFPIVVSPIGEHRLYLPLLAYLVPLVLLLRYLEHLIVRYFGIRISFWIPVIGLAGVWGILTFLRNEDYSTDVTLWKVTVAQEPGNARAHNNYGVTLLGANRPGEAASEFEKATNIQYDYADAHYNWGNAVAELGRYQEAISHYQVALGQKPMLSSAQNNWGNVLNAMNRQQEAAEHYQMALQIEPNSAQFHYNLGHAYLVMNKLPEALEQFLEALRINPDLAIAHNTLGIVYFQMGAKQQAIEEFQQALRLDPNLQLARENLNKIGVPTQ